MLFGVDEYIKDYELPDIKAFPIPKTQEERYYRKIFEEHYPNVEIIPHFWKPNYVNPDIDPSARALQQES